MIKPIKESELNEAVKRLSDSVIHTEDIKIALRNLKFKSVDEQKLILPTQQGILRFCAKAIKHIEGERNYSYIHLAMAQKNYLLKTWLNLKISWMIWIF